MERKGFIGGSDAVKIMRGDWLDLWKIKTGRVEPDNLDHVLPVQLGILTEDLNLSWFEREEQMTVSNKQLKIKKDLDGVPITGTLDGMVYSKSIIEAKHTNAFSNMKKVSDYYKAQVQLYMWLAEADNCYLSVIFGNHKWDWSIIAYDDGYMATVLDMIKEFWVYVETDKEPDINRGEDF